MVRRKRKKRVAKDVQVGNDSSPQELQRAALRAEAQVEQAMADAVKEKKTDSSWKKKQAQKKKRRRRCVQPESTTVDLCF